MAFDVASLKPSPPSTGGRLGPPGGSMTYARGKVVGRNVTARTIIREAYHLADQQILGGPSWLDVDTFELEAKAATPADKSQLRLMLRTMLAERFKLAAQPGSKEIPVYALMVDKGGPALHEMKPGDRMPASGKELLALVAPRHVPQGGLAGIWETRTTIQDFADDLSHDPAIGRPVLDKTGLTGEYLILMQWGNDDNFMSVVEEDFGLKFEAQRVPMDTVVIDHIEKPDAN